MDVTSLARWDGNDVVDLRSGVTNGGLIQISTGAGCNTVYGSAGRDANYGSSNSGTNQIWGGAGEDNFYVGQRLDVTPSGTTVVRNLQSRDLIWDWNQSADTLIIDANATAVIAGLEGTVFTGVNNLDFSTTTNNGTLALH
jgi:hypothetical protein